LRFCHGSQNIAKDRYGLARFMDERRKGAFADWWLSYRAELWFKLKMSRYDLTDFE
jgi:hypothetical protein